MQMKQCSNGHFYDESKTLECPYCNSGFANANLNVIRPAAGDMPIGRTVAIGNTVPVAPTPVTASPFGNANFDSPARPPADSGRTQAVIKKEIGIDPVVGWLICTEGADKGQDYRLHADNNYIGRGEKMDVCVRGDDTISRDNHAVVSYDLREKIYYFSPGSGRGIVRVNDKAVFTTLELKSYDIIELGNSKFLFLPLCGEGFNWKE